MAHVIVESSFDPPLTPAALEDRADRLEPCLARGGIRWYHSFVANDGRRLVCHYDAADAEAVRMALRSAGVPFDRVWTARKVSPEPNVALTARE